MVRRFENLNVFIPYIDTYRIFHGKNEFMIQFYISDVSFVAKYTSQNF